MTTETITLRAVETDGDVRWAVALDLSRDSLERLFALSLLDGERPSRRGGGVPGTGG